MSIGDGIILAVVVVKGVDSDVGGWQIELVVFLLVIALAVAFAALAAPK